MRTSSTAVTWHFCFLGDTKQSVLLAYWAKKPGWRVAGMREVGLASSNLLYPFRELCCKGERGESERVITRKRMAEVDLFKSLASVIVIF